MTTSKLDLKAHDIMTPRVVSIQPSAGIEEAVSAMLQRRISGLPVVDDGGRLVGMITEGDLLRRSELGTERRHSRWLQFFLSPGRLAEEYTRARGRRVDEVMTPKVVTATENTTLAEIVALMTRHAIKRVPVVLNGGPIGIVTRADVLRALARSFAHAGTSTSIRPDDEILADIKAEFERSDCIPTALVEAQVRNGDVHLLGSITDERERSAIRVAVECVPGVKAIHDHLAWVEPMSGMVLLSPEDEEAARRKGVKAA